MYKLLITIFLLISFPVGACEALTNKDLSRLQQATMRYTFDIGRPYDLSYSLAAIAWKESSAGRVPMNLNDPSFGVHHITLDNAIDYSGLKDTPYNRNWIASNLVKSERLSSEYSMMNLNYWRSQYGDNWLMVWASYNAGWNVEAGMGYARDIAYRISVIRKCDW